MVNIFGLSIVFAGLLLSVGYIKREMSYDHHYSNVERIVRMSLQFNNNPVDGRIYGNDLDAILQQLPEIERIVKMFEINTAILTYEGERRVVNNFYMVNSDFFHVFDIPLLYGDRNDVLQRRGQAVLSEKFARQLLGLFDNGKFKTSEINLSGWKINGTFDVSGIFKDIPETSHFHADILLYLPEEYETYNYTYLLLKENTDVKALVQKM
jgi:putative ABC transport system permease protein